MRKKYLQNSDKSGLVGWFDMTRGSCALDLVYTLVL